MSATPISWPTSIAPTGRDQARPDASRAGDTSDPAIRSRAPSRDGAAAAGEEEDYGARLPQIILALDYKDRKLAAAYYKAIERKLYVLDDAAKVYAPFDRVDLVRVATQPELALVSSRAAEAFLADQPIEAPIDADGGEEEDERMSDEIALLKHVPRTEVRPVADFGRGVSQRVLDLRCVEKLLSLDQTLIDHGEEEEEETGDRQQPVRLFHGPNLSMAEANRRTVELQLQGFMDATNTHLGFGCVRALLDRLVRQRGDEGEHSEEDYLDSIVDTLELTHLDSCMALSEETLEALAIFSSEEHPNISSRSNKQSLSLFGLVNGCKTPQGKQRMREWFLQPSTELKVIRDRHEAVARILGNPDPAATKQLLDSLRSCLDMRRTLRAFDEGRAIASKRKGLDWAAVVNFAFHCVKIRKMLAELTGRSTVHLLSECRRVFEQDRLMRLGVLIRDVIDFDATDDENRVVIRRGVDDELDGHLKVYAQLQVILDRVCLEIGRDEAPQQYAALVSCTYLPQIGFLTAVPMKSVAEGEEIHAAEAVYQHEGWTLHFSTDKTVFFKSRRMQELDEHFGDVHNLIVDREIELLNQLQDKVLQERELLLDASDMIATLDCIVAFADCARKYNWVEPEMTDDNVIEIDEGRHPLLEKIVDQVVPNSTSLQGRSAIPSREPRPSLILLTGANFSGKSIYMKQVALCVFLAHGGSFVPARGARIGLTDRILLRMNTKGGIEKRASTFMLDLQQVGTTLRLMTERSLVLIDEFGKGTQHLDGAGLMGGLIEQLADPAGAMPRCIVATHFHELLGMGGRLEPLIDLPPNVKLIHMRVTVAEGEIEEGDAEAEARQLAAGADTDIVCLYELADGPTLDSYGINCARLAGMPRGIVERARELLRLTADGASLADVVTTTNPQYAERLKHDEELAKRFLKWDIRAEPPEAVYDKLVEIVRGPAAGTQQQA